MALLGKVISKFRQGLDRTRRSLVEGAGGLRALLTGRRLDEALLVEVERLLLEVDVGVAATRRLIEGLRADFKACCSKLMWELPPPGA